MATAMPTAAIPGGVSTYLPTNAALRISDYAGISELSTTRLRFLRPISPTDGNGFQHSSPGSRVSFIVPAGTSNVYFTCNFNTLVTYADTTYGCRVSALVDGAYTGYFDRPTAYNVANSNTWKLALDGAQHTITLLWPGVTGLDLNVVGADGGAISIAAARPTHRLCLYSDSILQDFDMVTYTEHMGFGLSNAMNYELINMARGGGRASVSNGTDLSGLNLTAVWENYGYNDFVDQTALATYKANKQTIWTNIRTLYPKAWIICQTMIWTGNTNTLTPQNYRDACTDQFHTWGDNRSILVDGLKMVEGISALYNADLIHPINKSNPQYWQGASAYLPNG